MLPVPWAVNPYFVGAASAPAPRLVVEDLNQAVAKVIWQNLNPIVQTTEINFPFTRACPLPDSAVFGAPAKAVKSH